MDPQDELDEELGQPDPEATGAAALEQLGQSPGVAPPPDLGAPALPANVASNPPAAMPVVPPPQVPQGDHATKGTRTVEGLVPAPDLVAGQAKEQQVLRDEKKLAGDEAGLQGEKARIEQEQAEKVADETARQNAQIQAEQQYQMEQQQARQAQYAADIEKLRAQKPPGGFTEWAGGKRAAAMVSMAIGGLVSGRAGTANTAIQDVDRQVAQEQQAWTNEQHRQLALLNERKGLNHDMDAAGKDILAQAEARKALALDSLSKRADAQLKALGIPAAQQAGIKAQLGLDQKAAEAQQKYGQILSSKVTDATQFAPGKAGAGGGGQSAVINLVKMAEDGAKRSEIVAAAAKAGIPEKAWKNQVDLAFVEREKGEAAKEKGAAAKEAQDAETEVLDFHGNPIGNAAPSRAGKTLAAESHKRTGAAQALVAQLDDAIAHIEKEGHVAGVESVGLLQSEAYKERLRLLAGVQAKARAFSELPASEGGLHLEHAQIGSPNSASAEQLKKFRDDVIKQTNLKNQSLLTSASRAKQEGGAEKPEAKGPEVRVTKDGRVLMRDESGKIVELKRGGS